MCPAPQGEEAAQAAQAVQSAGPVKKQGLVNVFMDKAAQGFDLWFRKLVPAVLFGYVVVRVLEVTTPPGVSYRQAAADAARDAAADRSGETFARLMSKAEPP